LSYIQVPAKAGAFFYASISNKIRNTDVLPLHRGNLYEQNNPHITALRPEFTSIIGLK
jgi:hypothetical protein